MIKLGPLIEQYTAMCQATDTGELTFERTKEAAGYLGFEYRPAEQFQAASVEDSVAMLSKLLTARDLIQPNAIERAAFGGAIDVPALSASKLYARYKEIQPDKVAGKNEVQAQVIWRKFERTAEFFIAKMGDRDITKLTKKDIVEYRAKLVACVENGEFKSDAGNKYLMNLRQMIREVMETDYEGDFKDPFDKVKRITGFKDDAARLHFTNDEARAIRVKLDTFKGNQQFKAMMLVAENTGAGVTELCFLAPSDIVLDAEIPHIKLRPNEFRASLKTDERERDLPLIGVALDAMKQYPSGFADYRDPNGPGRVYRAAYALIKPVVPDKSFAGYRHRLVTLLRNSEAKDQFQNAIMGHATEGMGAHYGGPVWLKNMKKALEDALPADA
ncbi:hypothetical protein [Sinorhizobium sojae]|uniref:hypothetical protein n=1 Tax=Sinorhizobium sojae TaxID=716925 RepID=UPI0012FE6658|nr:hypothetical protein [Sinorhizobium sojae]